ncbi:PilZ domain-containing protein [Sphingomonas arenae]|uniref:PilZ domain-containing protein n=1 Tax=Sphingomonas arenae TaxID=2812555 RepID=UPI001966F6F0|nr:PilZ domain-containing protein [Sphingomonas arenae]
MVAFGRSSGGGRRAGKREAAPLIAILSTLSKTYEATLVDMSATGARLRADTLPEVDDELNLRVGRVKTFASVRWRKDGECGVRFYEPLLQQEVIAVRLEAARGRGLNPASCAALDDWILGVAR